MPARMVYVKKPDPDYPEGWKEKARVVVCGNYEEGSWQKELGNRAEVPDAFMMRCLIAEAAKHPDWSIGSADFSTAFLNASLNDTADGINIVKPPQFLLDLGIEEPGVYWKLTKAMYGLRRAPKKWQDTRDEGLKQMIIPPEKEGEVEITLQQCRGAIMSG